MATSKGLNSGYTGYPALIFYEMVNYGRGTQLHLEKMVILEKWYSHLRAYLPAFYEKRRKGDEFNEIISPLLTDAAGQIDIMNEQYDPAFEEIATCNNMEKAFCVVMRGVYERLDTITAKTRIIDGMFMDEAIEV